MIKTGVVALVGAALVLTACSASGGKAGSSTTPSSSTASTSPTTSSSAPAPRNPLLRVPTTSVLGDPVTAEVCAGLPLTALSKYGVASRHGYQTTGSCLIDISVDSTHLIQMQAVLSSSSQFLSQEKGGVRHVVGGVPTWVFTAQPGSCERAFEAGSLTVDLEAVALNGTTPGAQLCKVASTALTAQIAADRRTLPRRVAPASSFTRFDLCALLALGAVAKEPGMSDVGRPTAHDLGGQCTVTSSSYVVRLQVVTIDNGFGKPAKTRLVRGERMQTYSYSGSCEVDAITGTLPGGKAHEYLAAQVYAAHRPPRSPTYCRTAQGVVADVLTATGIR